MKLHSHRPLHCLPGATARNMVVGLGYSGGGITAMFSAMCAHEGLVNMIQPSAGSLTVSTASGGSLGYLLQRSTLKADPSGRFRPVDYPPPYSTNLTLEALQNRSAAAGHTWWANAVDYIPNITASPLTKHHLAANPDDTVGWWQDVMKTLFKVGYGVSSDDIGVAQGVGDLVQNCAVLRASGCPMKRNASSGVMLDAASSLRHASVEASVNATTGEQQLVFWAANVTLSSSQPNLTLLSAAAWSTAFYAAGIVESSTLYAAEQAAEALGKGTLISTKAHVDARAAETVHLVDGGFVDSTGIVALLRKGIRRILLCYMNNDALRPSSEPQSELASFAYLFGIDLPTDTINSLAGPSLLHVFPSELYVPVMANLTDGSRLFARATSVPVLANAYLGIESYTLDELLIVSNGRSDEFLASFDDARVAAAVSDQWPDQMPTGFGVLEANLLCEYVWWKLARHAGEIKQLFQTSGFDGQHDLVRV